jgi:hypothetical protein
MADEKFSSWLEISSRAALQHLSCGMNYRLRLVQFSKHPHIPHLHAQTRLCSNDGQELERESAVAPKLMSRNDRHKFETFFRATFAWFTRS